MRLRALVALVTALSALGVTYWSAPAAAQTERDVNIDFEVGDFDSERGDWPITAVNISGDLTTGRDFTVELRDGDGDLLWSGTDEYSPPQTTIEVGTFVAVGDVEEAGIAQRQPGNGTTPTTEPTSPTTQPTTPTTGPTTPTTEPTTPTTDPPDPTDPTDPVDPTGPLTTVAPAVGGDQVVNELDLDDDGDVDEDDQAIADAQDPPQSDTAPEVEGDVITQPGADTPVSQGNGFGGAGQLALSMVVAVIFVAILFRSPLPSATTTRWRK